MFLKGAERMRNKFSNVIMILGISIGLGGFGGCSSSKKEIEDVDHSETIKKDYEVRDASSSVRPGWVVDAVEWAKENNQEVDKFRFFSYETTPKVEREVACSLAKSNARADIAAEIASFIEKSLGHSQEGAASIDENNPQTAKLREFVEVTLAEKTQALIHGAAVMKTYWEKRQYLQSQGAKRDFIGFSCAVLVRIETETLKRAVEEAAQHVVNKVDDPDTKANVKKALQDASENFVKAKQGVI